MELKVKEKNEGKIVTFFQSIRLSPQNLEPRHDTSNNVIYVTSKGTDQPAHRRSLIRAFASGLSIL